MNHRTRLKRHLSRTRREHFPRCWCVDSNGNTVDMKARQRAERKHYRNDKRYWAFRTWLALKRHRDAERGKWPPGIWISSAALPAPRPSTGRSATIVFIEEIAGFDSALS